ncbi:hypothetical protein, partial [Phascolarctobacterium faecium]|uniref:hypothetical protein n=1 Tax=Phascolarctobacterium faecium TaxID=33025 RepID=UPI003A94FA86
PNTVVKPLNVESTWLEAAWEDRKLPVKNNHTIRYGYFFMLGKYYPARPCPGTHGRQNRK